jgi:Domain of Unknown Function (DUF1080)
MINKNWLKIALIAFVISGIVGAFKVSQNTGSKEGFTNLFNGKNWDGWHLKIRTGDSVLVKKLFAIEKNGTIHAFRDMPDSMELNTGKNTTHAMFFTNKKYSKYIFKFDYKWGKKIYNNFNQFQYDAGMYYHVFEDNIWPKGLEYQVRYDHTKNVNHTGDFWAKWVTIQWYAKDNNFLLPENGGEKVASKGSEHLTLKDAKYNGLNDKWNECEVIVMGNEYTIHKLNGQIVNVATNLSHGEGMIGLQAETAEVFYRNIKIKEFTESVPIQTFIPNWKNQ